MSLQIIAIGKRMPNWVEAGCAEYHKRLPAHLQPELIEIAAPKRDKQAHLPSLIDKEGQSLLSAVKTGQHIIALHPVGKTLDTPTFAKHLNTWQHGAPPSFLIGGPEGLSDEVLARADSCWSLSALTFPHPLVRIVLYEQLYRAWSLTQGHPYHR